MNYIEKLFSLKGKVAVVVGGSGELGGEMSLKALVEQQWHVR